MPGVSPKPDSLSSSFNPSQLQPPPGRRSPGLLPVESLAVRTVNGAAEYSAYFAFTMSRYMTLKKCLLSWG